MFLWSDIPIVPLEYIVIKEGKLVNAQLHWSNYKWQLHVSATKKPSSGSLCEKKKGKSYTCFFLRFVDPASQYIYLSNLPTWCTKFLFYNKFISCLYMFWAHVLIIRRSKLHYAASGIITLKQVSGLKLLKYNSTNLLFAHILYHSLVSVWWYQRLCNAILTSWWCAHVLETCRGMK